MSLKKIIKIRPNLVLLLILCVWGFPSSVCNAQNQASPTIENPIVFGWGRDLDDPGVPSSVGDIPTYAKFYFENLPGFDKEAVLNISLQSRYDFKQGIFLRIGGSVWSFDVTPNEIAWPGPISRGAVFDTKITIKLLEIGTHYLTVNLSKEGGAPLIDYNLALNVDETGQTQHLSSRTYPVQILNQLPLGYFKDQLVIKYRRGFIPVIRERLGFENTFRVVPVPKLGDTVDVHFSLVATKDYTEGVQLIFMATDNLEVLSLPKNWTGPVKKEEVYEGIIKMLFKKPGESRICLVPEANYYDLNNQKVDYINNRFYLSFVIDPDGKLSYVSREAKDLYKTDKPPEDGSLLGQKGQWPGEKEYIFLPKAKVLSWRELKKLDSGPNGKK